MIKNLITNQILKISIMIANSICQNLCVFSDADLQLIISKAVDELNIRSRKPNKPKCQPKKSQLKNEPQSSNIRQCSPVKLQEERLSTVSKNNYDCHKRMYRFGTSFPENSLDTELLPKRVNSQDKEYDYQRRKQLDDDLDNYTQQMKY